MLIDKMWWRFLLTAVFAYLVGNFNSAITISKLKKKDIRNMGSGNPGTMNMSRNFGLKIGLLVFVLDVLKGVVPTLIARIAFQRTGYDFDGQPVYVFAEYFTGFFVVLGHVFPVFYKLKGGKGIASAIGVLLVCNFPLTLILGLLALGFIFITRMGSMGSFLATAPSAVIMSVMLYFDYYLPLSSRGVSVGYYVLANCFIIAIIALTWFAHRENIKRLMFLEEHDTAWLQMIKNARFKSKLKKQKSGK